MKIKTLLSSLFLFLSLIIVLITSSSYSGGFGSYEAGCSCHGSATTATTVTINGLPTSATGYTAGASYPITVTVSHASLPFAGFQIQTTAGTFSSPGTGVSLQGGNMSAGHNQRKSMSGGVATFSLTWTAPANGATATFSAVGNAVDGSGNTGDAWNSANSIVLPLPVQFISFGLSQKDNATEIKFVTAFEENIARYDVQKSLDGISFTSISELSPKGNGEYIFMDYEVASGIKYYYRIKEIDLNGTPTYTTVESIRIAQSSSNINLYPTVVSNQTLYVNGLNDYKGLSLNVYNAFGVKVGVGPIEHNHFILPSLGQGMYIVQLMKNNEILKTNKIIIKE